MKNKNEIEQRSFNFEVRAKRAENDENIGVIIGTPIVYDSRTNMYDFDEIIEKGALDHADLKDVRFLVNHDISRIPLARSRNNNKNSTMQLMPNEIGMDIRVNLDLRNTESMNLYSAVERGDISGMSFMFVIGKEDWENLDSDHPTRRIKEISTVIEVSAVTFPAYEDTSISVRNNKVLESAKRALDNARKSAALDNAAHKTRDALELLKAKIKILGEI